MKRDLIEAAVSLAEAETRSRPSLASMAGSGRFPITGLKRPRTIRGAAWTPEEDTFLRANLGFLSERGIGRQLGRTESSVHNRWKRDLHLTPPRSNPNWLTLEALARGLDIDSHSMMHLANRGLLPTRPLPIGRTRAHHGPIRVVDRKVALDWIADPMHWIYFQPEHVGTFRKHGKRRLGRPNVVFWREAKVAVQSRLRTWKDAWLTPTEAARLIGLSSYGRRRRNCHGINKAINRGLLPAVRWGNWKILRSEALRFARERMSAGWGPRKIRRIRFKEGA